MDEAALPIAKLGEKGQIQLRESDFCAVRLIRICAGALDLNNLTFSLKKKYNSAFVWLWL